MHDPHEDDDQAGTVLSQQDQAILAFEHAWTRHGGAKDEAIRAEFGISSVRYYQLLGRLIETPAALLHDPLLVKRLLRLRDARTARRADLTRVRRSS